MISTKISCPKSYQRYLDRFAPFYRGSIGASEAQVRFKFTDPVVANYDGGQLTMDNSPTEGSVFEWYVDPPPVFVPGIIYINLTGLLTLAQITSATIAAIVNVASGFSARYTGASLTVGEFTVVQEAAGSQGNTAVIVTGGPASSILVNGVVSDDNNVYFYGGQDLLVPMLWGPKRAFGPTTSDTVQSEQSE